MLHCKNCGKIFLYIYVNLEEFGERIECLMSIKTTVEFRYVVLILEIYFSSKIQPTSYYKTPSTMFLCREKRNSGAECSLRVGVVSCLASKFIADQARDSGFNLRGIPKLAVASAVIIKLLKVGV